LYINHYFRGKPSCSVINVIPLDGLDNFIEEMRRMERQLVDIMKSNIVDKNALAGI